MFVIIAWTTIGYKPFIFIYDHWVGITTAAVVTSFAVATYVYSASFQPGKLLALGGNSGNFIYDVRILI